MKIWLAATTALALLTTPAWAQDHGGHEGHEMPPQQAAPAAPHDMHGMDHDMAGMDHGAIDDEIVVADMRMPTALGSYVYTREASGTSWQPDSSRHNAIHTYAGDWTIMTHALLNGVYDWQEGPRGDEKTFISGMLMNTAQWSLSGGDVIQLRAMLAPDPLMGARGYPLLFAAGETADGAETLIDRQHPHDLFMELSASYSHRMSDRSSMFVYGGLPGEPAFGPPAFMHRMSAMDSPEAPISHHWFDSTHIVFGVVTAGFVHDDWKLEASQFRGREPDEDRYDIESGDLDSTSLRASWNPTENLAIQVSWADITSPEALDPDEDETRWSASAIYTRRIGDDGWWSVTGAFGRKERSDGVSLDAWLAEAAWHPNENWTVFGRAEAIETDELGAVHHGPVENVSRLSLGAIRDWRINEHAVFGVGALVQQHFASDALEPSYDGDPQGAMGFVRLKIG